MNGSSPRSTRSRELTGLDFKLSPDARVEKRIERQRVLALWEPSSVDRKQRWLFLTGCPR